jgi:hypothetical protein
MTIDERDALMRRLNVLAQQDLTPEEHFDAIEVLASEYNDHEAAEYFDGLLEKLNLIGTEMRYH